MFFIYSNVAVLLIVLAPLAVSLHRGINIGKQQRGSDSQPRVHQMNTRLAQVIKQSVHREFPKARELGHAITKAGEAQAIVIHAVVEGVRPKRVRVGIGDGDGGGRGRIVGESRLGEQLEGVRGVVEHGGAEANDGFERDAGEGVESD